MNPEENIRFRTDSVNMLNLVIKYRKLLILVCTCAMIISIVVSLLIKPLFRSTVVIYPTTNVVETQSLFGNQADAVPLFGDETATEKILQILKSDHIKKYLVKRYDLMKHYGISENARFKYTMLDMRMKKYIVSRKTQYNSIEISVLDRDPVLAATLANDIAGNIDTVFNKIVKEAGGKAYRSVNKSYADQLQIVRSLEDSLELNGLNKTKSGIPANLKAGSTNSSWAAATGEYSPELLRLINMFESENENLSDIRNRLTEAKILSEQDLPYIHVINEAQVAEKKAFPQRTLIVFASCLSSLLILIFILAISESVTRN
jgi:tyrosine-protein kinase Etk/Wzc